MKRRKRSTTSKSGSTSKHAVSREKQPRWFFIALLVLVGVSILFKLYKAHISGIMIDEASSVYLFSDSVEHALTRYPTPNNHVLHSLMLCFVRNIFDSYIHWFRIPAVFFGVLYSISAACIVCKIIKQRLLALGVLAAVLFSRQVFDYSYLARGYAVSLGGFFAGIALILYLLKTKLSFRLCWIPILVLVLTNFICLGSMPSAVFIVAALNLYIIAFCSHRFFHNPPNRFFPALLNIIFVPLFSGVSLYLLYRKILPVMAEIIKRETKPGPPFFEYMNGLLIQWGITFKTTAGNVILYILLFFMAIALIEAVIHLIQKKLFINPFKNLDAAHPAALITVITLLSFAMMFVYRNILNKGLGYPRNQIYMIPLTYACIGILFDRFCLHLSQKTLKKAAVVCTTVLFISLTLHLFPSFYGAGNKTSSKAVLDRLRQISDEKTWVIRLSHRMRNWPRPLYYYNQYGYKTVLARHVPDHSYDVTLWSYSETPDDKNAVFLDREYFLKHHQVQITVHNPQLRKMLTQSQSQP